MLAKTCTSGGVPLFHSCYYEIFSRKILSMESIFQQPKQKLEGTKSELYGGCSRTVQPRLAMYSTDFKLLRGLALSLCKRKVAFSSGLTREFWAFKLTKHHSVEVRADSLSGFHKIQKDQPFSIRKKKNSAHHFTHWRLRRLLPCRIHMPPLHGLPFWPQLIVVTQHLITRNDATQEAVTFSLMLAL